MLELKKIYKEYITGDFKQIALDKVNLNFRKNEFVSILGPSGSGKTTLLNIIGGLDNYTSGDLIINEVSTKDFKDNDWDIYRNHRVGFIFQNYNLIGHQSILSNVELALTLSGVGKSERRKKAILALKKVGLEKHINKNPNQLSGGQMQRVAIARALVNDPDILLADEPTGALDSTTSQQIMKLLKEVAKDKLVIMVTHNPELARTYSTRIIELRDGRIISDSNPYDGKVNTVEDEIIKKNKTKKTHMSFKTALGLSFNNLKTKKGRTILTVFAGSIGIIGIALILSLSNGVNKYIENVEAETLSSYPLTIVEESADLTEIMGILASGKDKEINHDKDKIYSNTIMNKMFNSFVTKVSKNDLKTFKKYLDNNDEIGKYVNEIKYSYNIDLNIFNTYNGELVKVNPSNLMSDLGMINSNEMSSMYSSFGMGSNDVFVELMDNKENVLSQYDLIYGSYPKKYDEVVLIVNSNNEISDYTLYALGLKEQKMLKEMMYNVMKGEEVDDTNLEFSYEDICNIEFKLMINTDLFTKEGNRYVDRSNDLNYVNSILDKSVPLKVVGILRGNDDSVSYVSKTGGVGYTSKLTEYVINNVKNSSIVHEQENNKEVNIFTGSSFELGESYEDNLRKLGVTSVDNPSSISIYSKDFEAKENVVRIIDEYNKETLEEKKITYTDTIGLLINNVTTIVNIISYVLIAFVSISLVVSSIMIGIITYISVLERTKEIGILRSIGASKKDIARVFNAETFIIGLFAGCMGIIITLILNIPINVIINNLSGISGITKLPLVGSIMLIIISVLLTMLGGLIPSKIASNKEPVLALRTE
ncbi:MAG: ABC transporter ATP-binding protein/permease [Bacilli bacterium]|nr:ABC transporter ATP-binding protein/permease [Bacilli bacterium]